MRVGKPNVPAGWRRRLLSVSAAALVLPMAAGLVGGATAAAAPGAVAASPAIAQQIPAPGLVRHNVPSIAMGRTIPVDVQKGTGTGALYLLDGLRATERASGWQVDTNALQMFAGTNASVVLPVGGRSSFYADWINDAKPGLKYKWQTFLSSELPAFLAGQGIRTTNNAIMGISMAGSAALKIAADNPGKFNYAGSLSGYLNISAPGMPQAVQLALTDEGGFNANDMFGPPGSPAWAAHDATVFAPKLRGITMYISAGSGIPGRYTSIRQPIDLGYTLNGMGLEFISVLGTRQFQSRLASLGIPATFSFPALGIHAWGYWQDELSKAKPGILAHLGS